MNTNPARHLPSVSKVLETPEAKELITRFGHGETVAAIQAVIEEVRGGLRSNKTTPSSLWDATPPQEGNEFNSPPAEGKRGMGALKGGVVSPSHIAHTAATRLTQAHLPLLKPAINATGILLHTNLGRAVMPEAAREAVASVMGYCNVQMDLSDGARVHREQNIRDLICGLTGAEDALVVNNNAAGTLLALRALARGGEVVVSRGELIEIGGAFRIPDILSESGCVMREVGTTNKTHLRDYANAITPETAMLLKVHKSNYDIIGFTSEVSISELAGLGRDRGVPVMDDLGCGALVDLRQFGLAHEMTLAESLEGGADLVLASTDKLIGGPQGGLILGRGALIEKIRNHPLYRAMRVCKMTLAALEATLRLFKNPAQLTKTHPLYAMLARAPHELMQQAEGVAEGLRNGNTGNAGNTGRGAYAIRPYSPSSQNSQHSQYSHSIVPHDSYLGGGSLPGQTLPSFAVRIETPDAAGLARRLRGGPVPIVARVHQNALYLDMRTVMPDECEQIVRSFEQCY